MFNTSKYTTWYNNIIRSANIQNRTRYKRGDPEYQYFESHHILPKSLGGSNEEDNLVLLTPKEHYVCHLLLVKMTSGPNRNKMSYALWNMVNQKSKHQQDRVKVSSTIYAMAKTQSIRALSEDRRGKTLEELWGTKIASQMREAFKTRKVRGAPSDSERAEMAERMRRNHRENPWKRNFQINGQLPKKTCPHCGATMDPGNYSRYHGDKCKHQATEP